MLFGAASVIGAVAAVFFTLGFLAVGFAILDSTDGGTNSSPPRACINAGGADKSMHVNGIEGSILPFDLTCTTPDGSGFRADEIPRYVTFGAYGPGLTAVTMFILAAARRKAPAPRRLRQGAPVSSSRT
ncbi:hypothetical protein B4N89_00155 [Embleya scabrispora]|uniref:Uncharacterized protein n=1 Tax=Embleya scabrispora TaxID=159449 RepID=A0A1T3NRZ3_9ACTN|nr:hypothetical protein B4N89_00155 [Embleya scabrispora]